MEQIKMEQDARKRDRLFAGLMMVCFCVSLVFLGKNWIEKQTPEVQEELAEVPQQIVGMEEIVNPEELPEPDNTIPESEKPVESEKPMEAEVPVEAVGTAESEETEISETEQRPPLEFVTVGYDYFDDALLIGDSRMEGIQEYGDLVNATFFADSGMSVFKLEKKLLPVPGMGKVSFDEVLTAREYGKIYLMLGLNELGYKFEAVEEKYGEIVAKIREKQKGAVIYLCANLHVTGKQSEKDDIFNNENVNRVNGMIEGLADGNTCVYLDANEIFDDENGGLRADYSSDSFHVYARHYVEWVDWLCKKGIEPEQN